MPSATTIAELEKTLMDVNSLQWSLVKTSTWETRGCRGRSWLVMHITTEQATTANKYFVQMLHPMILWVACKKYAVQYEQNMLGAKVEGPGHEAEMTHSSAWGVTVTLHDALPPLGHNQWRNWKHKVWKRSYLLLVLNVTLLQYLDEGHSRCSS